MIWNDIACIVFTCVTMNHLGLVSAIEKILGFPLAVVNCPKCIVFWMVFAYSLNAANGVLLSLAISFLASYVAIWLELVEGLIDQLYLGIYEKIITANTPDTSAADAERCNT